MNYHERVDHAIELGLIKPGVAATVEVRHDMDCGILVSLTCSCDPEVIVFAESGPVAVLTDGTLEKRPDEKPPEWEEPK